MAGGTKTAQFIVNLKPAERAGVRVRELICARYIMNVHTYDGMRIMRAPSFMRVSYLLIPEALIKANKSLIVFC